MTNFFNFSIDSHRINYSSYCKNSNFNEALRTPCCIPIRKRQNLRVLQLPRDYTRVDENKKLRKERKKRGEGKE